MSPRWAVLSDVHANLPALRAVLADAERCGVEQVVCLGDLVGYGAQPDEVVELLREAAAVTVAGNHDLIATGRLGDERAGELARRTLAWTRAVLSERSREHLRQLPTTCRAGSVLMAHGSPTDPEEYVRRPRRADALLAACAADGVDLLLLGHTHQPWAFSRRAGSLLRDRAGAVRLGEGAHLLNPGSTGQSRARSADARYLVLDLAAGVALFRAVPYDVGLCTAALRRAGLPERTFSLRSPPHRRLARAARLGVEDLARSVAGPR